MWWDIMRNRTGVDPQTLREINQRQDCSTTSIFVLFWSFVKLQSSFKLERGCRGAPDVTNSKRRLLWMQRANSKPSASELLGSTSNDVQQIMLPLHLEHWVSPVITACKRAWSSNCYYEQQARFANKTAEKTNLVIVIRSSSSWTNRVPNAPQHTKSSGKTQMASPHIARWTS